MKQKVSFSFSVLFWSLLFCALISEKIKPIKLKAIKPIKVAGP